MSLADAIRRMPKAELHFHFEGAFRWSTIRELHPEGRTLPETPPWYGRPFDGWDAFTAVFRKYLKDVTGTPETLERHAFEVLEDLARQNVRYVELLVSHTYHARKGLSEKQVWEAVVRGRERARTAYGIEAPLFLGISRDQEPAAAERIFDEVAGFGIPAGWLRGIDLQSDERARPNRDFAPLYRKAGGMGLKLRAHAGELGGAENVRDAVETCGVSHISHGTRAAEDPAVVALLARSGAWLHLCPSSNVLLRVTPSLAEHPLRRFHESGVRCTVNADDPFIFGTDTTREYLLAATEMGFGADEIAAFAKNAFRASLLDPAAITGACREIDAAFHSSAIDRFVDAFNRGAIADLAALLAPDATAEVLGSGFPVERGREAIARTSLPHVLEGGALKARPWQGHGVLLVTADGHLDTAVRFGSSGASGIGRLEYLVTWHARDELARIAAEAGLGVAEE